jgi:hypothetical protein
MVLTQPNILPMPYYKIVISTDGTRKKSYTSDSTDSTVRLNGVQDLSYVEMTKGKG